MHCGGDRTEYLDTNKGEIDVNDNGSKGGRGRRTTLSYGR